MKLLGMPFTVQEILGVIVPGAIGTFILGLLVCDLPITHECLRLPAAALWPVALGTAVILGFLAHPLSHPLNLVYDHTYRRYKRRHGDPLLAFATTEAQKVIPSILQSGSVYAWAKTEVEAHDKKIEDKIGRLQGFSKMFRSLSLYLIAGAVFFATVRPNGTFSLACLALLIPSFLVFCEKRFEASNLVYQIFYNLKHATAKKAPATAAARTRTPKAKQTGSGSR